MWRNAPLPHIPPSRLSHLATRDVTVMAHVAAVACGYHSSGHSDSQGWASECPDVKNYKWRLNPVWHRMLYSCTHMATEGVKGLKRQQYNYYCMHVSSVNLSYTRTETVGYLQRHRASCQRQLDFLVLLIMSNVAVVSQYWLHIPFVLS